MTRAGIAAGGVVAVLVLGWTVAWFVGRGEVGAAFDAEIARLEARGIAIDYDDREIGGYPFAYTITLDAFSARLPEGHVFSGEDLVARTGLVATNRVTLTMPSATLDLAAPKDAPSAAFALESEEARLVLFRAEGRDGEAVARLDAPAMTVTRLDTDRLGETRRGGALEATEVEASLDDALAEAAGERRLTIRAARLDAMTLAPSAEGETAPDRGGATLRIADPVVTATGVFGPDFDGDGRVEIATGLVHAAFDAPETAPIEGEGPSGGEARSTIARLSGAFSREDEVVEGRLIAETVGITAEPNDPAARLRGGIAVERVEIAATEPGPLAPGAQPFALSLAAAGVEPDETMWTSLDPDGALAREAMTLDATVEGRTQILRPAEGAAILSLAEAEARLRLDALGARLEGEGRLEVPAVEDIDQPPATGEARLRLFGSMDLLRDLTRAGYLAPMQAQTALILAEQYTRPGETAEELIVDLTIGDGMLSINGVPTVPVERLPLPR